MAVATSILDDAGATLALIKTYLGEDNRENEEPVHDPVTELGADEWNKLVAGVAELAKRLRPGNLVAVPFELTGLAGSATAQAVLCGTTDKTVQRLFKDGTLVGITAEHSAAIVGGTLTVQPQIDGADTALSLELNSGVQVQRAHQLVADADPADVYDAGNKDSIEVDITTASLNPTGGDVHGLLWFNVGEEEDV